jgi:hypothetical protein
MSQPTGNQYPRQPQARPPRPRRKRLRRRNVVLLAISAILLIAVIANAAGGSGKPGNQKLSAASEAAAVAASLANSERSSEHACAERPPASRDIYVRIVKPGTSPETRRLGGSWRWDHVTGKCLTAVHFMTATAPRSAGHCTQVGYVTDNPGYDANATPAPRLPHTAVQAGPACAAAATAAAAPSSPAPAPPAETTPTETAPPPPAPAETTPPPAASTPAGCYPVSDEGTCYRPGEYCRDDDHGVPGVTGDGEAIICEDNDGWRWEPA